MIKLCEPVALTPAPNPMNTLQQGITMDDVLLATFVMSSFPCAERAAIINAAIADGTNNAFTIFATRLLFMAIAMLCISGVATGERRDQPDGHLATNQPTAMP